MKTILVPTDFSKPARWAFETAISIAKIMKGELVLLHVVEEPSEQSFNVEAQVGDEGGWENKIFTLKLIQRTKAQLDELVAAAVEHGVEVKTALRVGNPFHGIRTAITEHRAHLIVMGTMGHTKLDEMVIGSTAEKVVRYAKCPVLTVHEKPQLQKCRNIVYATSLSDGEVEFSDVVKQAQKMSDAVVHLVRINTPVNFQPDHITKRLLRTFAVKLRLENFTLNTFNDITEEDGIIRFAAEVNADLIAMATHGRTGFAHVLVGSIAEDVANHSTKPVLTLRIKS